MEDSRDRLPTERAGHRKTTFPQYLTFDLKKQNTDSTGSQDSILTQIPLPYHLPADQEENYSQDQNFFYADHHRKKNYPHFGDLVEDQARRMSSGEIVLDHYDEMSKPLDPNSSPYIPTGYPQGTMASDQESSLSGPHQPSEQGSINTASQGVLQGSSHVDAAHDTHVTSYAGPSLGAIQVTQYAGPLQGMNQGATFPAPHQAFAQEHTFAGPPTNMSQQNIQEYHHGNSGYLPTVDNSQVGGHVGPSYGGGPPHYPVNPVQHVNTGGSGFRSENQSCNPGDADFGSNNHGYNSGGAQMPQYGSNNYGGPLPSQGYGLSGYAGLRYKSIPYPGPSIFKQLNGSPMYSVNRMYTSNMNQQMSQEPISSNMMHGGGVQQMSQTFPSPGPVGYRPPFNQYEQGVGRQQHVGGYSQMKRYQPNQFNAPSNFSHSSTNSSSFSSGYGGPPQPPVPVLGPQGFVRTGSPAEMFDQNQPINPTQQRRGTVAGGDSYVTGPLNYGGTPVPKINYQELEFKSEPRILGTPILRSRRHQTISNIGSFRIPEQGTNIDSFPGVGGYTSQEDPNKFRSSPPKMLGHFNTGGAVSLTVVNDHDPFTSNISQLTQNPMVNNQIIRHPILPVSANEGQYTGMAFHGLKGTKPMSYHLTMLTAGGKNKPTVQEALDQNNLPFVEGCRIAPVRNYGVVKIENIPYSVTRPEIMAFLGRNAKIVSENEYEPIHIIMERVTSKTLDCYVEFISLEEAVIAVERFDVNRTGGRSGRLGQRHVEVEVSSQEKLMKELFPKAKNVKWQGAQPKIIPRDPNDPYNSGFQGFISSEELVMLVKHVESPQRSPFSKECPQRPFECLISTLYKYPWFMVDYITIADRNAMHQATKDLLSLLVERVANQIDPVNLSPMLLKRVWKAALRCPGLTTVMKDDIVFIAGVDEGTAIEFGLPPFAPWWTPLWTIGPKPGVEDDVLLYYIALIREATESNEHLTLAEQAARGLVGENLMGDLPKFIEYGTGIDKKTLAEIAKCEWTGIEKVLRMVLTPSLQQGPSA